MNTRRIITLWAIAILCFLTISGVAQKRHLRQTQNDDILYAETEYIKTPGWRLLYRGGADTSGKYVLVYYDISRIIRAGKFIQAWVKRDEKMTDPLSKIVGEPPPLVSQLISLDEYDCASRKSRWLRMVEYDQNGDLTWDHSKATNWSYIVPDSAGERIYEVFCLAKLDIQEQEMRAAAKFYQLAVRQENQGLLKEAKLNYYNALFYGPIKDKLILAIDRIEKKYPEP